MHDQEAATVKPFNMNRVTVWTKMFPSCFETAAQATEPVPGSSGKYILLEKAEQEWDLNAAPA